MSAIAARDIWKSFAGTAALSGVSLALEPGSIHALVGENGAGKSTLIKTLTGVHRADRGTLSVGGREHVFHGPEEAIASGVSAVHQERNLVPAFSVAENLFLHAPPRRLGFLDTPRLYRDAETWLRRVGLAVSPRARASSLSVAQGQLLEIARALALQAKVLLLDEPTASITEREAAVLFERLRELSRAGRAMLFVSHKLDEVFALCDRVTVIRDGRTILEAAPRADLTQKDVVTAMVGRSITFGSRPAPSTAARSGPPRLELRGVSTAFGHTDINLDIRGGEVVGLYGLVGAGRTELARALLGLERITGGTVARDGVPIHIRDPRDALRQHRIGYVSEDRKGEGLILRHAIRHNVAITFWDRLAGALGFVTPGRERRAVGFTVERMAVRLASLDQPVGELSGGNQQKISVAKWLASDVDILIIDEPTIGVDVRTKEDMYGLVENAKTSGLAILVITSDLAEVIRISDRILVMAEKRVVHQTQNLGDYRTISEEILHAIV
ncbi:sugar ABC transporter ATP-binding protein [Lichenihabitans sp. Uapishka_5]|uniref:sugar ABC transporter ATP-binding protein n=1 Tax=Lichenihabitans sp. Uapishka_5 TaxID=3037302 RepID=UPI0029E7CEB2|nr:sugar ABC transporter ATP-binding protein [Lichenihabitans sp. Uapishka_5]MDX7953768.1 sugar ABC transporter ATP-binding protein [Lichenihabitans sp. Uapishka_5]